MLHQNGPSLLSRLTVRAREQRRQPTPSEARLWALLRKSRLGVRFRRQHPLAPYIVDFYCAAHGLVVEVDGGYHASDEQHAIDAERDRELLRLHSVRILRVSAELVMRNPSAVIAVIRAAF
jgi:very-short-patch-repair endonuclease